MNKGNSVKVKAIFYLIMCGLLDALSSQILKLPEVVSLELKPGVKLEEEYEVTKEHLADFLSSGDVAVLSTPSMILFMENTSRLLVEGHLEEGYTTVGVRVDVRHLAPAPLGAKVKVVSVLKEVEGRKLTFEVKAYWGETLIGEGTHERFIVNKRRFLEKLKRKLSKS